MRGKFMIFLRRTHLFLGVFFAPLLLMFIATGWWQTTTDSDSQQDPTGFFNQLMAKFSSVHTDDEWPMANAHHHPWVMKCLVVGMCIALILSILIGLFLAWQTIKSKWRVAFAFSLGILVPVGILYFF